MTKQELKEVKQVISTTINAKINKLNQQIRNSKGMPIQRNEAELEKLKLNRLKTKLYINLNHHFSRAKREVTTQ